MTRFEEKLREVLKPEEPPLGFAERVVARTLHHNVSLRRNIFMRRSLRWAAAAVFCALIAVGGTEYYQERIKRSQSEAAKQQLMLALQIAGEQLQFVQSKICRP